MRIRNLIDQNLTSSITFNQFSLYLFVNLMEVALQIKLNFLYVNEN